ncbi:hypothetical protein ABT369_41025 [Dactylosporangium sp. NPDC000244]|uniref:hypothetical protein n=1 Tax=Dactylosporangium sp. NPDC000244 TaxID=3154365 RepID=UPI003332F402
MTNPALSARASLHWRGRLVELVLPLLATPHMRDETGPDHPAPESDVRNEIRTGRADLVEPATPRPERGTRRKSEPTR